MSVEDELREVRDRFLESVKEYLELCVLLEDVKRMRRFIEEVSRFIRMEASETSLEGEEKRRVWCVKLKEARITAEFRDRVSLGEALNRLKISPDEVLEAY